MVSIDSTSSGSAKDATISCHIRSRIQGAIQAAAQAFENAVNGAIRIADLRGHFQMSVTLQARRRQFPMSFLKLVQTFFDGRLCKSTYALLFDRLAFFTHFLVGALGLKYVDQTVAIGVDTAKLLTAAEKFFFGYIAIAVAIHLAEPQRTTRTVAE